MTVAQSIQYYIMTSTTLSNKELLLLLYFQVCGTLYSGMTETLKAQEKDTIGGSLFKCFLKLTNNPHLNLRFFKLTKSVILLVKILHNFMKTLESAGHPNFKVTNR